MADKRAQREQKKREKQKKRREAKQRARKELNRDARGTLQSAMKWPVGTCYLSQNWHEQGAHCHAAFVRTHASGRSAVVLCEVDLARRGIVDCKVDILGSEEHVGALMVQYSEQHALLESSAEQVVRVLLDAEAHGRTTGHTPPRAFGKARALFDGVDPEEAEFDVLVGSEAKADDGEKKGWFSKLFGG